MAIWLSDEERFKFTSYLEYQITSSEQVIEQMKTLSGLGPGIKKMEMEVVAMKLVAQRLHNTETEGG